MRFGLVGALVSLRRRAAEHAAAAVGFGLERGTTRRTTHAVFGRTLLQRRDAGWIAARAAAERGAGRAAMSENGFLRHVGVLPAGEGGDIARASLVDQSGLAAAELDLLALFDGFATDREPFGFRDLILARKYAGLIATGAPWFAIARSIHRAGDAASLTAKSLQVGAGQAIYVRHGEGLSELDGQLLLGMAGPQDDPDLAFAEAEAAEAEGRHDAAAALYARCLAIDRTDAAAAFNRANCLRATGREAEAEADYLRALALDPDFAEAWFNLAGLVAGRGRKAAARRHLERAIVVAPDYADAVFNLAALAYEAGDLAAARRWWTRYRELDGDSEWSRTAARGLRLLALQAGSAG